MSVIAVTAKRGKPVDTTADEKEIGNFSALSDGWGDMTGPMRPLHDFTPVRVDYILDSIRRIGTDRDGTEKRDRQAGGRAALSELRVLDIGCGGGLLAEPMARLGADVTGIDASAPAIEAARAHATLGGLDIDYHCKTAEALAAEEKARKQREVAAAKKRLFNLRRR